VKEVMSLTTRTLATLALLLLALAASASCDKIGGAMKNIPGKVAGQVLDTNGRGQGYISVELINMETNTSDYKINTEDSGGFMFDEVTPGKYKILVKGLGEVEIPSDGKEFYVGPGKTITENVTIDRNKQEENK
jgi:hypothetical protein